MTRQASAAALVVEKKRLRKGQPFRRPGGFSLLPPPFAHGRLVQPLLPDLRFRAVLRQSPYPRARTSSPCPDDDPRPPDGSTGRAGASGGRNHSGVRHC